MDRNLLTFTTNLIENQIVLRLVLQVLIECLTARHSELEGAVDSMGRGYLDFGNNEVGDVVSRFEAIRGRVRYHG